ncbi:MAG TPA: PLP-dependent aminotransferase family protein [Thermoanaerobaculia bacterium]|jgi:2-aminoadipate transaminase|nr:PLP-dependent aminotransferase family protein [Thermoanaerobaculia bacterium]
MTLREIMDLAARPGVLSLAHGLPAAELFPRQALAEEAARVLADDPSALQYGLPYAPLKTRIVEMMAARGVRCTEEQIFLTSGAQQGMDLLTRLLVEPGRQVLIEWAVYDGIQAAARLRGPEILTVASDPTAGIDAGEVEALLARGVRPAYLYVIPDGHNPLGASLDLETRQRLAGLARRYRVPILEDDAYGFLYYGEAPPPPLRSFEEEWVFYIGSFSKILAPSLRAGWLVVPEKLTGRLALLKHAADLDTPSFSHRMIAAYLEAGRLPAHLAAVRAEYRRRRDALLAALQAHFPPEVRWNRPTSGMFIWAELPPGLDADELLRTAVEAERVAFCPGATFCAGASDHGTRCMRLSFTNHPAERIEEGIRRLGKVIQNASVSRI